MPPVVSINVIKDCQDCLALDQQLVSVYLNRRAGTRGLLQPLAAKLFSHVLNVVKRTRSGRPHAQLSSGTGADYAVVLRQYLLPVPAYCAVAAVNDLQGVLRRLDHAAPIATQACNGSLCHRRAESCKGWNVLGSSCNCCGIDTSLLRVSQLSQSAKRC